MNSRSSKINVSEMHSPVPNQREHSESKKGGTSIEMQNAMELLVAPHKTSWVSSVWNLAAVHRPLHAIRNAPTTIPALHDMAARHRPSMRERTRCWLAKPMAELERLPMTVATSRIIPLWRIKAAARKFFAAALLPLLLLLHIVDTATKEQRKRQQTQQQKQLQKSSSGCSRDSSSESSSKRSDKRSRSKCKRSSKSCNKAVVSAAVL